MASSRKRVSRADESFNIGFVKLVKKHRCLYDKDISEFRSRDLQEKAWSEISQETGDSVTHCKERFRNLRSCLARYIKQQSGDDPQHRPYYLAEHMSFLLPFLNSTRQSEDSSHNSYTYQIADLDIKHSPSENDEEIIDEFDYSTRAAQAPETSTVASYTNDPHTMNGFIPDIQIEMRTPPNADSEILPSSPTPIVNGHHHQYHHHLPQSYFPQLKRTKLERSNGSNDKATSLDGNCPSGNNPDMDFLRSLLPDIRCLTLQQKRKFKIGVLQLIDEVLLKHPATEEQAAQGSKTYNDLSERRS